MDLGIWDEVAAWYRLMASVLGYACGLALWLDGYSLMAVARDWQCLLVLEFGFRYLMVGRVHVRSGCW